MKKIILTALIMFVALCIFGTDYYICLGSFLNKENLSAFGKALNDNGITTLLEKTNVGGKVFTRVIYNKKYSTIDEARNDLVKLKNNSVIKNYKVKDIWIRAGQIKPLTITAENKNENIAASKEVKKEEKKPDVIIEKKEAIKEVKRFTETPVLDVKSKYSALNKDGSGNILFSGNIIELNKEDEKQFSNKFVKPDKIFARCYFQEVIGNVELGDFWHELWLNGEFKTKVIFDSVPDASWRQIQIWVSEEDYKIELDNLTKGEYKLLLNVYKKDTKTAKPVKLASGELTYLVNQ